MREGGGREREREREGERERERERERQASPPRGAAGRRGIWHNGWERKLDASGPPFARASIETPKGDCVLRPPCDSGSCLLAGTSIPVQLDCRAILPVAERRANETTKQHKMNRQSNQPKTRGSSTPARRHLLLPSLEAL
ncbi:uncharacterized protein LOC135319917 [Camelus dromedarius]|uniref:uncharacterized protein LOC135319917 n=1 Tax=Camelus dromedarius TaxID=9838 RepID=UPI003119FC12